MLRSCDALTTCGQRSMRARDRHIVVLEEVASDIEEGTLRRRPLRPCHEEHAGVLAFAQLDHVARTWAQGRDRAELDRMIDVLTDSWWRRLSDE
jgi:hypothetical protein